MYVNLILNRPTDNSMLKLHFNFDTNMTVTYFPVPVVWNILIDGSPFFVCYFSLKLLIPPIMV